MPVRTVARGRVQVSDLHLQLSRTPQAWPRVPHTRHSQIARTIAEETIVSQGLAERMEREGVTGAELRPVFGCGPRAQETPYWKQLWVTGQAGRTVPPTHFGFNPFKDDEKGEYRCPLGHVSGLNLLSEVYVQRGELGGA